VAEFEGIITQVTGWIGENIAYVFAGGRSKRLERDRAKKEYEKELAELEELKKKNEKLGLLVQALKIRQQMKFKQAQLEYLNEQERLERQNNIILGAGTGIGILLLLGLALLKRR